MSKNGTQKKFSPAQFEAISALLERASVKEAAEQAGVAKSTVYRWLKDPDFLEALQAHEGVILDKVARNLILLAEQAVEALADVLADPTQDGAGQRRYAAQAILDNVLKLWELRNIEGRLQRLEGHIYDRDP